MTDSGFTRTAITSDGDERFVSLRRPLEASGLGMNLIILRPGSAGACTTTSGRRRSTSCGRARSR